MGISLKEMNIILLASAHNPSIMSPDWLNDKGLVSEKPENFIHTPDLSLFESPSYSIILDRQRIQIGAKKYSAQELDSIGSIACKYVTLLREIPYTALGLNLTWLAFADEAFIPPKIKLSVGTSNLVEILKEHSLRYGGIIFANKDPYRLTITPIDDNTNNYKFNYHFDLAGSGREKVIDYINSFKSLYDQSNAITRALV